MGLQFHRRHGDDMLAFFQADSPGLGDLGRARYILDADELRRFRQIQGLADAVDHVFRRPQDEQFRRMDSRQRRPHGCCIFRLVENGPAHGLQAVRLFLGRPAGNDTVVVDEQAVVDDGLDIVVIGDDQGMMALAGTTGPNKTENFHESHLLFLKLILLHHSVRLLQLGHRR